MVRAMIRNTGYSAGVRAPIAIGDGFAHPRESMEDRHGWISTTAQRHSVSGRRRSRDRDHVSPRPSVARVLDNPVAVADLKEMYRRMLDVAAEHRFVPMMSGLDYRASPDWGDKLGYSRSALADALDASITLLRDVAKPYEDQIDEILIGGMLGPRGDAYSLNRTITAEQAEDYHSFQLEALKRARVDAARSSSRESHSA